MNKQDLVERFKKEYWDSMKTILEVRDADVYTSPPIWIDRLVEKMIADGWHIDKPEVEFKAGSKVKVKSIGIIKDSGGNCDGRVAVRFPGQNSWVNFISTADLELVEYVNICDVWGNWLVTGCDENEIYECIDLKAKSIGWTKKYEIKTEDLLERAYRGNFQGKSIAEICAELERKQEGK